MYAPSACNAQPWQFVVIEDRKLLCEVPDIHSYAAMAAQAPLAILVCGDTSLEKVPGYWVIDCAAAVQNLLQATASKNSSRFNPGSHAGPKGAPAGQASTQAVQVPQQQVSTGVPKGNGASVSTVM
jgi:nitroreductase